MHIYLVGQSVESAGPGERWGRNRGAANVPQKYNGVPEMCSETTLKGSRMIIVIYGSRVILASFCLHH